MVRMLLAAVTLLFSLTQDVQSETSLDNIKISAQPKYALYEPIVFSLEGVSDKVPATFWWRPFGRNGVQDPGYRLFDSNKTIVVWAGPGTYEVACLVTVFDVQWEQRAFIPHQRELKATFTVGDAAPVIPPVTPPVTPPVIPPVTPADKFGMTKTAFDLAMKIAAPHRTLAKAIADNFESVASAIAAGAFGTPGAANTELAGRNRNVLGKDGDPKVEAWRPFFAGWGAFVDALNKSGKATTLDDYKTLFLETAAGLKEVK